MRATGNSRAQPSISATAIQTGLFQLGQDLAEFVIGALKQSVSTGGPALSEGGILAVTSKIVSLSERTIVSRSSVPDKMTLVKREADTFLAECAYGTALTIKHGILIPAAGIDESNSQSGDYILFPKQPYESARKLHAELKTRLGLKQFGLIITDSHTHPLRRGVTGIGLSHWGFRATRKLVGEKDLYGRPLAMTYVNTLDALSVAAVYAMGESAERCPLAIVEASNLEFTSETDPSEVQIPLSEDLYASMIIPTLSKEGR